ncbi:MAG: YdeI/OmpD-associated family protein [Flavobacteriales bacterium]
MKIKEEYCPSNQQEWRNWLELNHKSKEAIWLIFYKKKSPKYNLSWSQAVDEALCFGWIDSVKKTIDHETYIQYFSKRKPKSNWSKVNKDKVKTLIENGLMKEEGLKSIAIAKENGSWVFLDDVEALIVPEDLKMELENREGALDFFNSLSDSSKKMFLYWVHSAKRSETRQKRILEIAENANQKLKPKKFR